MTALIYVAGTLVVAGLACVYILIRNEYVYRYRTRLLIADFERYQRLPSYDRMVYRFWVWPLSRFEGRP